MMNRANILNFLLFQMGWFVTCLSAAWGKPVVGVLFISVWLVTHIWYFEVSRRQEVKLIIGAAIIGVLIDSTLVYSGVISFPAQARLGSPTTVWMVMLWMGFAATLSHSLGWLRNKTGLAMVFGFLGGPLAYFAGDRFGAINMELSAPSVFAIGISWAIAMFVLTKITSSNNDSPAKKGGTSMLANSA